MHREAGPVSLGQIAQRQAISAKYLESLFQALRAAGIVHSVRGPQGGYALAKPPEEITLRRLFEVFEGSEGFVPCTTTPEGCARSGSCVTREVWAQFYEESLQALEKTTLADLIARARAAEATVGYDYVI